MAELTRAAQWVGGTQAVVASLAAVTAGTLHIGFALAGAGEVIAAASVLRPLRTAHAACRASRESAGLRVHHRYAACLKVKQILTYAGVGAVHLAAGVGLVAGGTLVTLWSRRVVQAVVAHASTPPAAGLIGGLVKVAALGVVVALTSCGGTPETLFGDFISTIAF